MKKKVENNCPKTGAVTKRLLSLFHRFTIKGKKMNWEDSTTYARGEEKIQTSWTAKAGIVAITVTNGNYYAPGKWFLHCPTLGIKSGQMKISAGATPEEAQEMAVRIVERRLQKMLSDLHAETNKAAQPEPNPR